MTSASALSFATPSVRLAPEPSTAWAPVGWVLDTNIVLDWLVFRNPVSMALGQQITSGQSQWLASERLLLEFERILQRGMHRQHGSDPLAAQLAWRRHARMCPEPLSYRPGTSRLRCTDASDQMFIDLALAQHAQVLISHDRAVLALRKAAARSGLRIARPSDIVGAQRST